MNIRLSRVIRRLAVTVLLSFMFVLPLSSSVSAVTCGDMIGLYEDKFPTVAAGLRDAQAFIKEHDLPTQVLEVGPEGARRKRLFIAIDITNQPLQEAYMKRFNLDSKAEGLGGYLALEFQREQGADYVTGVLRPSGEANEKIYRWGRPDLSRPDWVKSWLMRRPNDPIIGFAHTIPLTAEQRTNVEVFLKNPDLRAPCKADNCVAWTSSIELGKTAAGASAEDRNFLFTHLGMSRSMAHFEIGRRLVRAANENNSIVFVFTNGEKGKVAFETELEKMLPPDPKIPYISVIKGFFKTNEAADKAIDVIPDGAKVFVPIAAGASPDAMASLIAKASKGVKGLDVHVLVNGISETLFRQGLETGDGKFRVHALFLGGNLRKLNAEGRVAVIPGNLADFPRWVAEGADPTFHYDAIVVRVSPPDAEGRYSLGPNHDNIMTIIKARPNIKIIAEVNKNVPFTTGDNFLTKDKITSSFESNTELAGPPVIPVGDVEKKIGENIAKLVPNGATIQLGIGNIFGGIPDAIKAAGTQNLKIHSEMFGDVLKDLIVSGNADEAVTGFAYGSQELYAWLDHNPKVVFKDTLTVNDPGTVAAIPKFVAVNTALQVDLFGQSNATIGPDGRRMSSPGGQVEFMSGASRSIGGRGIIAIRSTAKNDTISSITLKLYDGPITTPHENVTEVVTEYGVASLRGKSEKDRAIALMNVAHPKFRTSLFAEAVQKGLVSEGDRARVKF